MRKLIVTIMASLLSCSAAFAFWPEATDSSLEIGVGYRQDKIEWRTHTDFDDSYGCNCDLGFPLGVRSRVKWRDLRICQIEARGDYVTCDNIYLRANGDYGWITSGKNKDCDFVNFRNHDDSCDDSSVEFSHSRSKARGHVYDAKIALGYQFKMCDDSFAIAPLFGYSWHGQHVEDRHLKHESYFCSESYSGHRRNSKYHTRWNGWFVGFDFDYRFGCGCEANWELFGDYEFHFAEYHAKANWLLRQDLCDGFRHRAKNAYGHVFDIGIRYDFCECWTLALKGEFQWWWADRGHDRAKIAEASCGNVHRDCFIQVPLRKIKWQSAAVMVDVGMVF